MRTTLSFRDEIVARLLAVGTPLDHWIFSELRAITNDTEHSEAAGVFESAGEASVPYCDGSWDDVIDVLVDEYTSGS